MHYASVEESWDRHREFHLDTEMEGKYQRGHFSFNRVQYILDAVSEGSRVLEMGCNSGGLSSLLMQLRSCFCYGVDVAPRMVARANAKGIPTRLAPAEETGFSDGEFDVVVTSELLEHVFEPAVVLREAHRVLKPGGLIVGSVPHEKSLNTKSIDVADHTYHCRVFTEPTLRKELEEHFKEVEVNPILMKMPDGKSVDTPYGIEEELGIRIIPKVWAAVRKGVPQWYAFKARKL